MKTALGIDIGGTGIKGGVVDVELNAALAENNGLLALQKGEGVFGLVKHQAAAALEGGVGGRRDGQCTTDP